MNEKRRPPVTRRKKTALSEYAELDLAVALFAARAIREKKAERISCRDLRGLSDVADYFVIATVRSRPQMRAAVLAVDKPLKNFGLAKLGLEGDGNSQWNLIDYGGCIVHLFSPELREYYDLDGLWEKAPEIDWENADFPDIPGFPQPDGR